MTEWVDIHLVDVRGELTTRLRTGTYEFHLQLSATPPPAWTKCYEAEKHWSSSSVKVKGQYLIVRCVLDDLFIHLAYLKGDVAKANQRYRDQLIQLAKQHEEECNRVKAALQSLDFHSDHDPIAGVELFLLDYVSRAEYMRLADMIPSLYRDEQKCRLLWEFIQECRKSPSVELVWIDRNETPPVEHRAQLPAIRNDERVRTLAEQLGLRSDIYDQVLARIDRNRSDL